MNRMDILEKIKKVQVLAQKGMPGERDNAADLLEKLMEQHGITEQDLEAERVELAYFRYKTDMEARLLGQIIYMIMGDGDVYIQRNKKTRRPYKLKGCYCTAAERVEIELTFKFYRDALDRDMSLVYRAFIHKNELFPPPDKARGRDDEKPEELSGDEKMRLAFLMEGLERHNMRPMLTKGGNDHVQD